MAGPWEKYKQEGVTPKPWEGYSQASEPSTGQKQAPQDMENKILQSVGKTISPKYEQQAQEYKKNLPNAFTGMGGIPAAPATAVGRIGATGGLSALMGYLRPGSQQDKLENAAIGGLTGAALGAAGEGVAGLSTKAADRLQQMSVGMRKYFPGVGNELVNQGVYGTKNQMANKVATNIADQESQLQSLVKDLKGDVPSTVIADAVADKGNRFTSPSGETAQNMASYLNKVKDASNSIRQMGKNSDQSGYFVDKRLDAPNLLSLKRQGDYLGYTNSGNPATSLEAELGRAQADASREALSKISEGQETTVPDILKQERASVLAGQALDKPETLGQPSLMGALSSKIPGSSLGASVAAKGLQQGVAPGARGLFGPRTVTQGLDATVFSQPKKKNED